MLVKLLSDLHLHGNNPFRYVDHGEHVCILAGDISEGMHGVEWALARIPRHIQVLYVPGNHEYYGQDYPALNARFAHHNTLGTHVHVMLNSVFTKDNWDVEFVGTTLWSDFNLYDNPVRHAISWKMGLNDSRWIKCNSHTITPQHFQNWNSQALVFLKQVAETPTNKSRVLVTHYCPDLSVAPKYRNDPLTPGFATRIPVDTHEKFQYHFHGHTHSSMNYEYNYGTKVVCNPRGYGYENMSGFNEELVLDI
jgi:hypothetical protein